MCAILDTGNPLLLKMMCEREIDIHQSTYPISYHATLLDNAASKGHVELVRILIASRVDIDKLDDFDYSPLGLAAESRHEDVVALPPPISKDIINAQNISEDTAPIHAVSGQHDRVVEMPLKGWSQVRIRAFCLRANRIFWHGLDAPSAACPDEGPVMLFGVEK